MNVPMHFIGVMLPLSLLLPSLGFAQRADQADPSHFKVEFENECVRVARASYGPGEKSDAMFDTAKSGVAVVSLTGGSGFKIHKADGTTIDAPPRKPGEVYWAPSRGRISLENTSNQRVEWISIWPKPGCPNN